MVQLYPDDLAEASRMGLTPYSVFADQLSIPPTLNASLQEANCPIWNFCDTTPAELAFRSEQMEQRSPVDHTRKLWQIEHRAV